MTATVATPDADPKGKMPRPCGVETHARPKGSSGKTRKPRPVERSRSWEWQGNPVAELATTNRMRLRIRVVWSNDRVVDEVYRVVRVRSLIQERVTWSLAVEGDDDERRYEVDFARPGAVCCCPDYVYRKRPQGEACKHALSLAEALESVQVDPLSGRPQEATCSPRPSPSSPSAAGSGCGCRSL